MNIISVFAGRRDRLDVLMKYLRRALSLGIVDQIHLWNFCRKEEDVQHLKEIANLGRTSSHNYDYDKISPILLVEGNVIEFALDIICNNDIHVRINNCEIVIGGWGNTKSVIRYGENEIYSLDRYYLCNNHISTRFKFRFLDQLRVQVFRSDELVIDCQLPCRLDLTEIYFKTGHNASATLNYESRYNNQIYYMDTCNRKNWNNYYKHYLFDIYYHAKIIKCDDDIIFIDLDKLPKFLSRLDDPRIDILFANIINNCVCAYHQQETWNLIPRDLIQVNYPTCGGVLWRSGQLAEKLHRYFIANLNKFLTFTGKGQELVEQPVGNQISINFFVTKGSKWHKIANNDGEDEYYITVSARLSNFIDPNLIVSHLSFYTQDQSMDIKSLIKLYDELIIV